MIDNKHITPIIEKSLRALSYEDMIKIFHQNCADCPFRIVKLISDSGREEDYSKTEYNTVLRVLSFLPITYQIERGCGFGEQELTLQEIILNTCRFWRTICIEGGSENEDNKPDAFIIIEENTKGNSNVANGEECIGKVIPQ